MFRNPNQIKRSSAGLVGLFVAVSLSACSAAPTENIYDTRITFAGTSCSSDFQHQDDATALFSYETETETSSTGFSVRSPFRMPSGEKEKPVNPCQRIIDSASTAAEYEEEMVSIELQRTQLDLIIMQLEVEEAKAESAINLLDLEDRYKTMKEGLDFKFEE